ncbi:MAG: mechanosensitive ion channel [Crenarchaeota archaeon]|nr:mechanosensitive ion channel [Thermoproteota archaeon]
MLAELLSLPQYYIVLIGVVVAISVVFTKVLERILVRAFTKEIGEELYRSVRRQVATSIMLVAVFLIVIRLSIPEIYLSYITMAFYLAWTILGGYICIRVIDKSIEAFHIRLKIPRASIEAIRKLTKWLTILIIIFVILHVLNILKNVIAITMLVIGTLIFLAFAGWSIMGNITAGIVLMIWKPFQIGDSVEIIPENISGRVEDITLMFTKIKTEQGDSIYIPNTLLMQKVIKTRVK